MWFPGGLYLVGGEPGIGKSTLLLQALAGVSVTQGVATLYVTGEESEQQVAARARRVGAAADKLAVLATTELSDVLRELASGNFGAVVVDSIQTMRAEGIESAVGSVAQLREVTAKLLTFAKEPASSNTATAVFLVGHVTKEGTLAGPRLVEHMVDAVLSFEGERTREHRIVRAIKNRYGSTGEIGVFEMGAAGLSEVSDPSQIFVAQRPQGASGSIVVPTCPGNRPLLVRNPGPRCTFALRQPTPSRQRRRWCKARNFASHHRPQGRHPDRRSGRLC